MSDERDPGMQRLWQDQPRSAPSPSLDEIRVRSHHFDRRTRRWRTVGALVGGMLIVVNAAQAVWPGRNMVERTGDLLIVVAFAYIGVRYRKHVRGTAQPEWLGRTSCADFYRARLQHEHALVLQGPRYVLPFVPGVSLSLAGGLLKMPTVSGAIVLVAGGILLFAAVFWWNALTARRLQREIELLDAP